MDKERSPGGGRGLPPISNSRYSPFPSPTANFPLKSEASPSSSSSIAAPGSGSNTPSFSQDVNKMPDFPTRNAGHRRAHSEILCLPDDISFDSDLGVVGGNDLPSLSDENDDDIVSMYMDMEKYVAFSASSTGGVSDGFAGGPSNNVSVNADTVQGGSIGAAQVESSGAGTSSQRPNRARHQHSQSMDGSTSIKTELLGSGSDGSSLAESKKAMSAAKLADLALVDPKRAKRIWANRQSAARSKERKMRYISELERKVQTLQTEATTLSAQLTMLQRDTTTLTSENSELKLRLQTTEQQVRLQDALNDALRDEVQRLKILTGQAIPNGTQQIMNYGSSSSSFNPTSQPFYPQNHNMQSMLASHQLQQLNLHSQQQQQQVVHPNHLHQQVPGQLHQQLPHSEVKIRAPPTHSRRDGPSEANNSPPTKE